MITLSSHSFDMMQCKHKLFQDPSGNLHLSWLLIFLLTLSFHCWWSVGAFSIGWAGSWICLLVLKKKKTPRFFFFLILQQFKCLSQHFKEYNCVHLRKRRNLYQQDDLYAHAPRDLCRRTLQCFQYFLIWNFSTYSLILLFIKIVSTSLPIQKWEWVFISPLPSGCYFLVLPCHISLLWFHSQLR